MQCTDKNANINASASFLMPVERFKELCLRKNNPDSDEIDNFLDHIFDPETALNLPNRTDSDTLKLFLTGGENFETFKTKLKAFDTSNVCGLVWNINYVAYRCRTCALSPCMSICAECFKNGNHEGHDYNMFRSGAGGACDCGDACVMNPNGFCKLHGCNKQNKNEIVPDELTKCCQTMISALLYRILQYFRRVYSQIDWNITTNVNHKLVLHEINSFIDLLNELCTCGTALQAIIVDCIISEEYYADKIERETQKCSKKTGKTFPFQHKTYAESLSDLEPIKVPDCFKEKELEIIKLTDKTMVDEFLYWCIVFEFPESLVKFLLSLLPDLRYKLVFVQSFVTKYSYISVLLLRSKSEHLSSKVVHISVQLFSSELVASTALKEYNLLEIVLSTLHNMIVTPGSSDESSLLIRSKLDDETQNNHLVVDPDHSILQENLYWLIISDLVNLLSHRQIAIEFLNNDKYVNLWFELVAYFQCMNLNIRQFGEHVVQEQPTYFSSFSAELEFCASIMWSLIQHLKSKDQLRLAQNLLKLSCKFLKSWFAKIGLNNKNDHFVMKRPNFRHISFHLPLHRYFSTFLYNSVYLQDADLSSIFDDIIFTDESTKATPKTNPTLLLANLLTYPLQLQIVFHEIHANMWVRNGMQMKGQAMTYVQNHFCSSFSDADLFLIQVLASRLDPSLFMSLFLERFHLRKWLQNILKKNSNKEQSTLSESSTSRANLRQRRDDQNEISIITNIVEGMLEEFNYSLSSNSSNENNENNSANASNNSNLDPDDLEPTHQIAMLIGAFTVLAQILMIRPNLRLKTYSLTRKEVVYILSIADRTFSQVEENLPDICSLSSSKKFIQPILNQVSDYLQPDLDLSSVGSLKQGRYKLKDKIWLNEYDPLLVMCRSVKRREYQESFDRFVQFVEKKKPEIKSKTKDLWPPFRLPNFSADHLNSNSIENDEFDARKEFENDLKLEEQLADRWNILNTKILHALILTILYENYYVSAMNEKVMYFVIYILELSVCNKANRKAKSSSECSHASKLASQSASCGDCINMDELNYETWFKSDDIAENLCSFVPFVKYEKIPSEFSKKTRNESTSSARIDDYDTDAGNGSSHETPKKRVCSGISSIKETSEEASDSPSASESSNIFEKTYTCESILSLLVKTLHKNMSAKSDEEFDKAAKQSSASNKQTSSDADLFRLEFLDNTNINNDPSHFENTRIGDENDFIMNLLDKASKLSEKCRMNIEKTVENINILKRRSNKQDSILSNAILSPAIDEEPCTSKSPLATDEELKNKKLRAKARQQKLLAQMTTSQRAFLSNPSNKTELEALQELGSKKTPESVETKRAESAIKHEEMELENESRTKAVQNAQIEQDDEYDCCICRFSSKPSAERPIGLIALIQSTNILGHRESLSVKDPVKKLPLSDEIDYRNLETDTLCWKQEQVRIKNMREAFSNESCKYSVNIGWKGGVYAQMCGHYLHFDCYHSYKKTLDVILLINAVKSLSNQSKNNHFTLLKHKEQQNHLIRTSNIEYTCPLCRQLANCVLPITPLASTKSLPSTISNDSKYEKVLSLLKLKPFSELETSSKTLTQCKNDALTILTLVTPMELRYLENFSPSALSQPGGSTSGATSFPVDDDIAMFATSVLRTQLEIDTMLYMKQFEAQNTPQKRSNIPRFNAQVRSSRFHEAAAPSASPIGNTINFKKKRCCFLPLFDAISTQCRLMCHENKAHVKQWLMLVNPILVKEFNKFMLDKEETSLSLSPLKSPTKPQASIKFQEVPLLLRDPIAILLLTLANIPASAIDREIFNYIVTSCFSLVLMQAIINLSYEFDEEERNSWCQSVQEVVVKHISKSDPGLTELIGRVLNHLKCIHLFEAKKDSSSAFFMKKIWSIESVKNHIQKKCMHFLRLASILQSYFYNEEANNSIMDSFDELTNFLNVESLSANSFIKLAIERPSELVNFWLEDLFKATIMSKDQVNNLIRLSYDQYHFPLLLALPNLYSDIFSYYLTKKCVYCGRVPRETAVCLVCGAQICYKTNCCCDSMKDLNKRHLNACGAGTLILLNINSTYVFVVRGKRCAPWASLYLDEHGEEDRDLKRGKPLYLNEQRYNLLKSNWLSHTFDYQSLKWYNASLYNH